jgi:hypothetical protein
MNIGPIYIKIKSEDLIRFWIGWFDLSKGLIKDLIKFIN